MEKPMGTNFRDRERICFPRRLNLRYHSRMINFTNLLQIQDISLVSCSSIEEVNSLGNVTLLRLSSCHKIVDVSGLGQIPDLHLWECDGVHDISALQNNKRLFIYSCASIVRETANFVNVVHLSTDVDLSYEGTTTLKNAESIDLWEFTGSEVFLPSTVVSVAIGNGTLDISANFNLSNFSGS
jgi:hypothetical protein